MSPRRVAGEDRPHEKPHGDVLRDRPRDSYVLSTEVGRLLGLVPVPQEARRAFDDVAMNQ